MVMSGNVTLCFVLQAANLSSEFADVTESLAKVFPLAKLVEDPQIAPYFRSLTVS